ncbi:pyridoxamine 5'-phosphate oxidase family protein [Lacinutrix neustonica]|uniref:Pyridoxamine 5'-phosphate oxidase family protein n=1 Tax=Lacinutrix neustonica TaxID=2980107 RepID=A0A9E8MWV9_9FLAO|nr:pyridoxamine 5'-phosphate oxidase family protein [Lacinutrix neustonica]WAC02410.1 pyridoxamine 5'-phosphate oxidase family protein [Lacinutrix neustonica]
MSTNNLYHKEAKEKIKALAEAIDFTMMATNLGHKPFSAIPMSTKKVDQNGTIWFLSGKDSQHNKDILKDHNIQLMYSKPSTMSFMILYGEAKITKDHAILKELYGKSDDLWFEGIEDPNLTAIQFEPKEAHYWEPKHNKLVTLFKMGVGALTGKQAEIGEEGQLTI